MFRFLTYLAFSLLATVPLRGSLPRAQSWKPIHRIGAQQLSLEELRYLVVPDHSSQQLSVAIEDLQVLYLQRYQRSLLIVEPPVPAKQAITFEISHVGAGGAFSIRRAGSRVYVRGADAPALANAVYAICADLMGARWYWAGELGFEWAAPAMHYFPNRLWREHPVFVQRQLHPADTAFARRNRLNQVYSFNHNLAKVFTPAIFEKNPAVFAAVNGRRKTPKGSGGTDLQIDFTNPDAVEIAAQAALAHFASKPNSTSFSLSINNNVLFDTSERTQAVVSPLRYFRGRPDYTDLVFGFMNRVAERVFDEAGAWQTPRGEDRYLTALSYYWTEPSPTIPIHSRVMPVLTSDRAQWHDPAYRAQDKQLIRRWAASGAARVATWDYYFGAPYLHPRQFNEWIGESIQFLADAGVDVFFSQLPSFWGLDGGKAWLTSKLLWDPDQDVEQLLNEYYANFFGAAAEPMRAFYQLAERHRNENEGEAEWIKLYKDESGIALFTPEVLQLMRAFLNKAGEVGVPPSGGRGLTVNREKAGFQLVDTARYAARVEVVSRAFRLTELYAEFDQSRRSLVDMCLDNAETRLIEEGLRIYRESMAAYYTYLENYLATSEYAPSRRHIDLGQSNPERLAQAALAGESQAEFYSLAQDPKLNHRTYTERNFLGPLLPDLDGWNLDYRPSKDFKVIASEWGTGNAGLRIENADIVSVFRTFPVVSNQEYQLRLRAAWQISLDNRVHLQVAWLDRDGQTLGSEVPLRLPSGQRVTPASIRLPFTAPNNAYDLRVRLVISRQYSGDYLDVSEIDFGSLR